MHFSARVGTFLICLVFLCLTFVSFLHPSLSYAQTNTFNTPNTDSNVPSNQHYFAQSTMIEVLSAVVCQLAGIDLVNPQTPCLGVDPTTNKLGFAPTTNQNGSLKVGGLLGQTSSMIAFLYTPTTSTSTYVHYLSDNFGIVKQAHAQEAGYGFTGLQPLLGLWTASRDIAYFLFVVAFMIIGLGIMLRVKIDPRTVMTVQNQIPRIIIGILLITFSYAIAALMIDAMWLITYIGINELVTISKIADLGVRATPNLLYTPLAFADKVFNGGVAGLTADISGAMGGLVQQIIAQTLGLDPNSTACTIVPWHPDGCLNFTVFWVTHIVMFIVILIALLFVFFRLWFELLKAYTFTLVYIITAPLWIVVGLLPGRPLGFEKWLRSLFVNLATFPAVALMIILARVLMDVFNGSALQAQSVTSTLKVTAATGVDPTKNFIPPLVGDPNMKNFGVLIAFGILLMTTTMLNLLRDAMKVPGNKHGAAIAAGFGVGMAAPSSFAKNRWNNWTRRNSQTGAAEGFLSKTQDDLTKGVVTNTIGKWGPFKGAVQRHYQKRANQFLGKGFRTNSEYNSMKQDAEKEIEDRTWYGKKKKKPATPPTTTP